MGKGIVFRLCVACFALLCGCSASPIDPPVIDAGEVDAAVTQREVGSDTPDVDAEEAYDDARSTEDAGDAPEATAEPDGADAAGPASDPRRCEESAVARASVAYTEQRVSSAESSATDCNGGALPAVYYRVALAPGQRLVAAADTYAAFVRVLGGCGSTSCVAREDGATPPRTVYQNRTDAEQRVVVAVSARPGLTLPPFALTLTITTPPPPNTCATAPVVSSGAVLGGALGDASLAARCDGSFSRSLFYAVDVPPGQRLAVDGHVVTRATIMASCEVGACLGAEWPTELGSSSTSVWTNDGAASRRVLVALSQFSESGPPLGLSATVTVGSPNPEAACATARALTLGAEIGPFTGRASSEEFAPCAAGAAPQPALWWRVTVPAGRRVVLTQRLVASTPSTGPAGLALVEGCGAGACVAGWSGVPTPDVPLVGAWRNEGDGDRVVYVVAYGIQSSFTLRAQLSEGGPSCAAAPSLDDGATRTGQRLVDTGGFAPSCAAGSGVLPTSFYRVTVPAGQRVEARVRSAVANLAVRLVDGCDSMACLAQATVTVGAASSTSIAQWANEGTSPRVVVVAVSRSNEAMGLGGEFEVAASTMPGALNGRCATPTAVADGAAVRGDVVDARDRVTDCAGGTLPALYYRAVVPAGRRLEARLAADRGGFGDPFVRIIDACDAAVCAGARSWNVQQAWWTNSGAAPRAVLIAVSSRLASPSAFTLSTALTEPPANGRCDRAARLTSGDVVTGLLAADAVEATSACGGDAALAHFFRIEVPSHRRVTVRVSSEGGATAALLDGCVSPSCLAASSTSVTDWVNEADEARDVVIALRRPVASLSLESMAAATVTLAPVPGEGFCATATETTAESVVDWSSAGQVITTCGGERAALPSIYRKVTVPPGQRLTATLRGTGLFGEGLRLLSSCEVPECLTPWATSALTSTEISASWRNETTSPRRVIVAASRGALSIDPAPSLSLSLSP